MKSIYFIMLLFIMSCKVEMSSDGQNGEQTTTAPASATSYYGTYNTSIKGQIYYNLQEIVNSEEEDMYEGFNYKLYDFRIYLVNEKHAYRIFPDYEGNFFAQDIEPGMYQIIVKSKDDFADSKGDYTYMITTTATIKEGVPLVTSILHPVKVYTSKPEVKNTLENLNTDLEDKDDIEAPKGNTNNSAPQTNSNTVNDNSNGNSNLNINLNNGNSNN